MAYGQLDSAALDRWITGNYGEDQYACRDHDLRDCRRCAICEEACADAEMVSPDEERGFVHSECGVADGWEVA